MSVILTPIPQSAFELIRDRIGAILAEELDTQAQLTYDAEVDAVVYIERFTPFNQSEYPAVNVSCARVALDGHTIEQSNGTETFVIDIYQKSNSAPGVDGSAQAVRKMHRLVGICRAILEHSKYQTLGFKPPFISSRRVVDIKFADPETTKDSVSVARGRIIMEVKCRELNGLVSPPLIDGYETVLKLNVSDAGYYYFGETY